MDSFSILPGSTFSLFSIHLPEVFSAFTPFYLPNLTRFHQHGAGRSTTVDSVFDLLTNSLQSGAVSFFCRAKRWVSSSCAKSPSIFSVFSGCGSMTQPRFSGHKGSHNSAWSCDYPPGKSTLSRSSLSPVRPLLADSTTSSNEPPYGCFVIHIIDFETAVYARPSVVWIPRSSHLPTVLAGEILCPRSSSWGIPDAAPRGSSSSRWTVWLSGRTIDGWCLFPDYWRVDPTDIHFLSTPSVQMAEAGFSLEKITVDPGPKNMS